MKAIVIGATGATGSELIEDLLQREWITEVIAFVRAVKIEQRNKLTQIVVDFNTLESYSENVQGDIAFSCLGTTLKDAGTKDKQWVVDYEYQYRFAKLCKANGIKTFVLLSAVGASPKAKFFYTRMKGELERDIKLLNFDKLIIVKPSLLVRGNRARKSEDIFLTLMNFLNKMGCMKRHTPLPTKDVAHAMAESIDCSTNKFKEIDVDGIIKLNRL